MPRQAKITISRDMLSKAFGFDWTYTIVQAQIDNSRYCEPVLELIVECAKLPEIFYVDQGMKVKEGTLIVHERFVNTEIKAI